ncbi:uncharacterized protein J8A68_002439 [[Candida] subhashii]|uniref:TauD/TfdA-like domain-containing protein n=1 Tax=[Candida] subhashii TaxID=561895 RepID=A0A8J5QP48_9ASCO|nr:uncharacterized protein J8A68_002439 [[Candida] subhashii]KAG7664061.1 hypothetical protein J8A68_002439 [[Candida] subhashii]
MLTRLSRSTLSRAKYLSVSRFVSTSSLSINTFNDNEISLSINDKNVKFKTAFLRDSCQCPKAVDQCTKQKLFTTSEGADKLSIASPPAVIQNPETNENILSVKWSNNGSIMNSKYPVSFLENYSTKAGRRIGKFFDKDRKLWDKQEIENNLESLQVDYNDFFNNEEIFFQTVYNLNKYGLTFINNIPEPVLQSMNEENATQWPVFKLASRFGYIKKTFYGTLFDVKNEKEEAKNIANSNTFLPLHMDLLYYESPPGLQLLHFLKNSTIGGENIFCDSFLAAQHVRNVDPVAYDALTKIPITYHYDNNGEYYYFKRPVVIENPDVSEVTSEFPPIEVVNYSPPFQGPLEIGIAETEGDNAVDKGYYAMFDDFLKGLKLFEDFINDPKNHFEIKMKEGSCVIFENRRALHSRNGFSDENGGDRWLMGTYVDGDSFRSKLRTGYRKFK